MVGRRFTGWMGRGEASFGSCSSSSGRMIIASDGGLEHAQRMQETRRGWRRTVVVDKVKVGDNSEHRRGGKDGGSFPKLSLIQTGLCAHCKRLFPKH